MLSLSRHTTVRMLTEITLLVLMLWPAPIPVGHSHDGFVSPTSDQQLVRHLLSHHGGWSNTSNWSTGWHWHWVLPEQGYVGLAGEVVVAHVGQANQASTPDRLTPPQCSQLETFGVKRLLARGQATARQRLSAVRQQGFHNVALLHNGQSLPELFGIILC